MRKRVSRSFVRCKTIAVHRSQITETIHFIFFSLSKPSLINLLDIYIYFLFYSKYVSRLKISKIQRVIRMTGVSERSQIRAGSALNFAGARGEGRSASADREVALESLAGNAGRVCGKLNLASTEPRDLSPISTRSRRDARYTPFPAVVAGRSFSSFRFLSLLLREAKQLLAERAPPGPGGCVRRDPKGKGQFINKQHAGRSRQ